MTKPTTSTAARPDITKSAVLSPCELHRYELRRTWAPESGLVNFIGLNPSTADASADDPTIRKCVGFARAWGHGGIIMTNLFSWRATSPRDLLANRGDARGPDTSSYVLQAAQEASLIVCAWGSHTMALNSYRQLWRLLAGYDLFLLNKNADGMPSHPLYQLNTTKPALWRAAEDS